MIIRIVFIGAFEISMTKLFCKNISIIDVGLGPKYASTSDQNTWYFQKHFYAYYQSEFDSNW